MFIRFAEEADIPKIVEINIKTWRTTYAGIINETTLNMRENNKSKTIEIMTEKFNEGKTKYLVAEIENEIAGFTSYGMVRGNEIQEEKLVEIYAIYVLKEYQKLGMGKKLIKFATEDLAKEGYESLLIWTLEKNPSKNFYKKIGGEKILKREFEICNQKLDEVAFYYKDLAKMAVDL